MTFTVYIIGACLTFGACIGAAFLAHLEISNRVEPYLIWMTGICGAIFGGMLWFLFWPLAISTAIFASLAWYLFKRKRNKENLDGEET